MGAGMWVGKLVDRNGEVYRTPVSRMFSTLVWDKKPFGFV